MILEGFISIKAALKSEYRKVNKVYVSNKKRTRKSSYMKKLCTELGVEINFVDPAFLEGYNGGNHGGFIAEVEAREFQSLDEVVEKGTYFWLEGIEDPYNFGSVIRTVYASGAKGIIIDDRDWSKAEKIISRSSAGCYERIPIAISYNSRETAHVLHHKGFTIYATMKSETSIDLYDVNFERNKVIVIGGERRGITAETKEYADEQVHISYGREFGYSLPATIASSIVSFELYRQNYVHKTKDR